MKVRELLDKLESMDPEMEIAILDGFNGGGYPRTINYGPKVTDAEADSLAAGDTEDLQAPDATKFVVMGYGCY